MMQQTNNILNITIGNITVNLFFVSIALGLGCLIIFVKWFLKKIEFDKFIVVNVGTGGEYLKGKYIYVNITNIGNHKIWLDKIVIYNEEKYIEIDCNKQIEKQKKEHFEKRYSEIGMTIDELTYFIFNHKNMKIFIFYKNKNNRIYMIKEKKHKLITIKKYNSFIKNINPIWFETFSINIGKERLILTKNIIYYIQFVKKNSDKKWEFYCVAVIYDDGRFYVKDKYLISKTTKPFSYAKLDESILKEPKKIVDFIKNNLIDTSVNDIGDIKFAPTPYGDILSHIAK